MEKTIVTLTEEGPIEVRGVATIIGADGKKIEFTPAQLEQGVYLCRCGKSTHKPLCDGSHGKRF